MESKEAIRERVKRFRLRKRGEVLALPEPERVEVALPGTGIPVLMKMIHDIERDLMRLEDRVTALESRESVEPVVREVLSPRGKREDSADLFKRVMVEKAARVRGEG